MSMQHFILAWYKKIILFTLKILKDMLEHNACIKFNSNEQKDKTIT